MQVIPGGKRNESRAFVATDSMFGLYGHESLAQFLFGFRNFADFFFANCFRSETVIGQDSPSGLALNAFDNVQGLFIKLSK